MSHKLFPLDAWGQWYGRKHYSLQVVQHPLRARMCGFGDKVGPLPSPLHRVLTPSKDRRPLAPAAVAKMVVRREDNSLVDVDELDSSFFLVTVDLWSADGKREMNLVLHPSSTTDRYISSMAAKQRKHRTAVPSSASPCTSPSSTHTPVTAPEPPRSSLDSQPAVTTIIPTESPSGFTSPTYSYTSASSIPDPITYSNSQTYNTSPESPEAWGYPHPAHPSQAIQNHPLRNSPRNIPAPTVGEPWSAQVAYRTDTDPTSFRTWSGADSSYPIQPQTSVYNNMDPSNRPYHPTAQPDGRDYQQWNHSQQDSYTANYDTPALYGAPAYPQQSPQTPYYSASYPQSNSSPSSSSSPRASSHPLPRPVYTRTLVGPLSSNGCRLLDEHQIPGIFFLFQDLSVRTEGSHNLIMRDLSIALTAYECWRVRMFTPSAPEPGAQRVHTNVSPVLAQTFTEPFVVFSAKRFPGVPGM
ncbi:velvet factor [Chiua virens]|nr:velvet factor [Chiua virens]